MFLSSLFALSIQAGGEWNALCALMSYQESSTMQEREANFRV